MTEQLALALSEPAHRPESAVEDRVRRRHDPYVEFDEQAARQKILELCAAGEWVSSFEVFNTTGMHPSDVSCQVLLPMAHDERVLEEKHCYYGASDPGDKKYAGYYNAYRLRPAEAE